MDTVEVTQQIHRQNPQEFCDRLFNYWNFWTRDPTDKKDFRLSEDDSVATRIGWNSRADPHTLESWIQAIHDIKAFSLSKAQCLIPAVMFKCPYLRSPKQMLFPVSKQCLQGWRKLDLPRSRLPLPWEVVCLMAKYMMKNNMVQESWMMLLKFVLYLRPGEIVKAKCQDLPPTGQGRQEAKKWALLLRRQEEQVRSKTAEFDEALLFDLPYTKFVALPVRQ